MNKFLKKLFFFVIIIIASMSFILIRYGAYIDYFYLKFTTPKQSSFILGDSRSFQGIQPKVINSYFSGSSFQLPMFNYSFMITQAAYGEPYINSVKNKLNLNTKRGLFILTVNPWLLAKREHDDFKNCIFTEDHQPPHNMNFVTINPNFEYLIKNFNYFHFKALFKKNSTLHKDGWMEENNLPKDKKTFNEWSNMQINMYQGFSDKWSKSSYRMLELEKLIVILKAHGTVILVRLPINTEILNIENKFWVNFNLEIKSLALKNKVKYINFSKKNNYSTYDGNHIDKFGGKIFTKDLCDSINYSIKKF